MTTNSPRCWSKISSAGSYSLATFCWSLGNVSCQSANSWCCFSIVLIRLLKRFCAGERLLSPVTSAMRTAFRLCDSIFPKGQRCGLAVGIINSGRLRLPHILFCLHSKPERVVLPRGTDHTIVEYRRHRSPAVQHPRKRYARYANMFRKRSHDDTQLVDRGLDEFARVGRVMHACHVAPQ